MLQAFGIGVDDPRQILGEVNVELELLGFSDVAERPVDVLQEVVQLQFLNIDDHRPGFDL